MLKTPHMIPATGGKTAASLSAALDELLTNQHDVVDAADSVSRQLLDFEGRLLLQLRALQGKITSLKTVSTRVGSTIYLDAHDLRGCTVAGTNIQHLPVYGVILPLVSTTATNQFTLEDAYGDAYIPNGTLLKVRDAADEAWLPVNPTLADRALMALAFDGVESTAFSVDMTALGVEVVKVQATIPQDYLVDATTNMIAIHPAPSFAARLVAAVYSTEDLEADLVADAVGWPSSLPILGIEGLPALFIIPPTQLSSVGFSYSLSDPSPLVRNFSISHLGAYHVVFASSAAVTITVPRGAGAVLPAGTALTGAIANLGDADEMVLAVDDDEITGTLTTDPTTQCPQMIRTLALTYEVAT